MKKKDAERIVSIVLWIFMVILGADIVIKGLKLDEETWEQMMRKVQQQTMETYLPGMVEEHGGETAVTWLLRQIGAQIPVFIPDRTEEQGSLLEDSKISRKIAEENSEFLEAKLLEENQEAGPPESGYENTGGVDAQSSGENTEETVAGTMEKAPVTDIPLEKFQDFDFEKQTVRISRQIVGNLKVKEQEFTITEYAVIERNPKTENSYRILRVPKVVMREVKHRQQLIDKRKADMGVAYKDYDYVSCQENGEPRSLTAMNQALTKICKRNGLPNITVHGLRHMFATILIELGVPLFKISGLLGHSSVHTTYEYYCEIMDEQDKIIAFVNNTFVPQQTGTEG